MNKLKQHIREHYSRELHPMVFELLDKNTRLRAELKKLINKAYGIVELDVAITNAMEALEEPND